MIKIGYVTEMIFSDQKLETTAHEILNVHPHPNYE